MSMLKGSNNVALGYDEGGILIKVGDYWYFIFFCGYLLMLPVALLISNYCLLHVCTVVVYHKNDFVEIMGFIRWFRTTYLKKVHKQNIGSLVH